MLNRALSGFEKVLGPVYQDILTSAQNLEIVFYNGKKYHMSKVILKKALAGYQNLYKPKLQDICTIIEQLD